MLGLLGCVLSIIANVVIITGAVQMRRLKNYRLALAAAVLTIIPCIGPWGWIGMLLGMFALWTLTQPAIRSAFVDPQARAQARSELEDQLVHRSGMPYLLGALIALPMSIVVNVAIGYMLLQGTEWGHKLAWPVTAFLGTILAQLSIFVPMYLYVRHRRGAKEAARATVQGVFCLLGADDPSVDPRQFRAVLTAPGIFAAGIALLFSLSRSELENAQTILIYIALGSAAWGIATSFLFTLGGSSE